jgi:HK97 family phage major capsid protein/HK97 family phage prohead protease
MPDGELKIGQQRRDFQGAELDLRRANPEGPVTLSFSASSENGCERWYGTEVLDHSPKAVRLARVEGGNVPMLFNHNWDDPIGMVDRAQLVKGRLQVDAHLFDTPRAREIATMIDGGLRNISIGYQIHAMDEDKKSNTFTARDWEPMEISVVSIPADASIGIGRTQDEQAVTVRVTRADSPTAQSAEPRKEIRMDPQVTNAPAGATADIVLGQDFGAQERLRIKTLQSLGRNHNMPADVVEGWIDAGATADDAAHKCLEVIAARAKHTLKDSPTHLGLSQKEIETYSISRAIKACTEKSWPKVAPYEAEASKAIAQRMGKSGSSGEHTFFVPLEVQWAQALAQRDTIVGTNSMGGFLVGTNVMSFIEMLRNRSVAMRLGATNMPGLVGSVSIPKQLTAATAYWFANESGTATESDVTFGQITLVPKTVGGYVEISRQLLLQSTPNADGVVNADLARVIGLAVDSAAIAGPGTAGQPTGVRNTAGIGTANPTAGTNVVYSDAIRFQTTVASSNAMMPGFGYVTTPTVAGILMGKPRFTNSDTPIWGGNILEGQLVGARAMASLQVGSGTVIGGDWSNVIIGEWGVLEIEANPYANFQSGIVGVRALYTVDVGVRYAAAFAVGTGFTG